MKTTVHICTLHFSENLSLSVTTHDAWVHLSILVFQAGNADVTTFKSYETSDTVILRTQMFGDVSLC